MLGPMCLHEEWDVISKAIIRHGRWHECDKLVAGLLEELARQGRWRRQQPGGRSRGTFLEVGANIGACTLQLLLANATVVAFEPSPSNLFYATSTLAAAYVQHPEWAGRLTLYPLAAGDARGNATLYGQIGNAGHSVVGFEEAGTHTRASVEVYPLDELLPPDATFDMMKVDVEGFECKVFQGARQMLMRGAVRRAAFEVYPTSLAQIGCSARRLVELVRGAGFRIAWPLAKTCEAAKYGCDLLVSWGHWRAWERRRNSSLGLEACSWESKTVYTLPDHRGWLVGVKKPVAFDECV